MKLSPPPPNIFDESHNYRLVRRKAKRTAQRINALRYLVIDISSLRTKSQMVRGKKRSDKNDPEEVPQLLQTSFESN